MTKQSVFLSIALVGLGAAFAVLSVLVWLSRGHPAVIRHKLRIGALLISVSAMLTAGATGCIAVTGEDGPDAVVSCYLPAPPRNQVSVDGMKGDKLTVFLDVNREVTGHIWYSDKWAFSFRVADQLDNPVQVGDLQPTDGAFDEYSEAFVLVLDRDLPAGEHDLDFYMGPADQQASGGARIASRRLIIVRRSSQ
jgi:hypothetical protein